MKNETGTGLKFTVPPSSMVALRAEMAKGNDALERGTMATLHLDTEGHHLARAGLAWKLQREGRRWIQSLAASRAGDAASESSPEHEVIRPRAEFDAAVHADSPIGHRLLAALRAARQDGLEVAVRSQTEVRRLVRRVRTRGATVEVIVDEGRRHSDQVTRQVRSIHFRLASGSTAGMLGLVDRWRKRFGLIYEPRSESERGEELLAGHGFPPLRKAVKPVYDRAASVDEAFDRVLAECIAHITRNAIGLCEGDPALRVEHVHQMRVAIRRLRSALRSFEGWTVEPPVELIDPLRALFATLGQARDADVLGSGVMAELQRIGAPMPAASGASAAPNPAEVVRSEDTQRVLLAWVGWSWMLRDLPAPRIAAAKTTAEPTAPAPPDPAPTDEAEVGAATASPPAKEPASLRQRAAKRLRRWHRRIVEAWKAFDGLDEERLHALRKLIKRQRYAVEFFAPALERRQLDRYVKALASIQERMGDLNDLFVAQKTYQAVVPEDPTAWFALGWLTARIATVRAESKPHLEHLAKTSPPK